jgi:hypothetical protein
MNLYSPVAETCPARRSPGSVTSVPSAGRPRDLGGFQGPLATVLELQEEFGRLDASVA